ncbi:MAG: SDR family oxidoreductase [Candidatus Margulisiibacteriota bacterium]
MRIAERFSPSARRQHTVENLFNKKKVFIFGPAGGIGHEFLLQAAEHGAEIVACVRPGGTALKDTDKIIGTVEADLAYLEQIEKAFENALELLGRIDIIINCAGTAYEKPITDLSVTKITSFININITSAVLIYQKAMELLPPDGHLIMVASKDGQWNFSDLYSAAKDSVYRLMLGARRIYSIMPGRENLNFHCIMFGIVPDTNLFKLENGFTTEQIAVARLLPTTARKAVQTSIQRVAKGDFAIYPTIDAWAPLPTFDDLVGSCDVILREAMSQCGTAKAQTGKTPSMAEKFIRLAWKYICNIY